MRARLAIALAALGLGCAAEPAQRVAGQSDPDGPRTLTADHTVLSITTLSHIGHSWLRRNNPSTAVNAFKQAIKLDDDLAPAAAPPAAAPAATTAAASNGVSPSLCVRPAAAGTASALGVCERARLRLNLCAALCQMGGHGEALSEAEAAVAFLQEALQSRKSDENEAEEQEQQEQQEEQEEPEQELRLLLATALHNACVCHEHLGQPERARARAERALRLARSAHLPEDDRLLLRLDEVARSLSK